MTGRITLRGPVALAYKTVFSSERRNPLLKRVIRGRSGVAVVDQAMVSAANFFTSIVLVRALGLAQFGKYAIMAVLILYVSALQASLVSAPMLSLAPLLDGQEKRRLVNGMLTIQLIVSLFFFAVTMTVGVLFLRLSNFYTFPCILMFAIYTGAFQLQDWLKRYYFLYHRCALALTTDFVSYVVQLGLLFVLWRTHQLNLFVTLVVMCGTSVVGFLMGPLTDPLHPSFDHIRSTWRSCRKLSRDLSVSSQVRWLGAQGFLIIGTWIVGAAELGGLRATYSLAGPVNLILNSLENFLPIHVAEKIRYEGGAGAYAFLRRAEWLGLIFFGLLLFPVALFGRQIIRIAYGPALVAFYVPMILQLLVILSQVPGRTWSFLFRGLQDSRALVGSNIVSAATTLILVYPFGRLWGATGLVLASLCSQLAVIVFFVQYWSRNRERLIQRHTPESYVEKTNSASQAALTAMKT